MEFYGQSTVSINQTFRWWSDGLWDPPLMVFAMQMMLMLVLGHTLALSPAIHHLINGLVLRCTSSSQAALIVSFSALLVGLFNWGLGLIFGGILARKIGEHFSSKNIPFNYPLIGAAGYSALMIWHAGISGSALIKVAEKGNLASLMTGIFSEEQLMALPNKIGLMDTVFSTSNLITCVLILVFIPITLFYLGKNKSADLNVQLESSQISIEPMGHLEGAEKIDYSSWIARLTGTIVVGYCVFKMFYGVNMPVDYFTPNNINLSLFGMGLLLHKNFNSFSKAVESAISGASGILIQFPLYFGIMGIFKESGMVRLLSDYFVAISNQSTYPILTYISAGIVNIFIPSGGGQWVIQGPIIIQAAQELNVSLSKCIMALAYGDQITNMLQPFWALPLLGITRLSAREILPYTLIMFLVGFTIYLFSLMVLY